MTLDQILKGRIIMIDRIIKQLENINEPEIIKAVDSLNVYKIELRQMFEKEGLKAE